MIRITGGEKRGLRLKTVKGDRVRPTQDRLRKTVFDILHERVVDARFLDLFAGTGAMGIEALSRGAKDSLFVEKDRNIAQLIKENLAHAGYTAKVVIGDAKNAVEKLEDPFDIIFLDPPYGEKKPPANPLIYELITLIDTKQLLSEGGTLFIESSAYEKWEEPAGLSHLHQNKERQFGRTRLTQFSCRPQSEKL